MLVVFRVDASSDMGLGHLKRSLSLGHAVVACGGEVLFLTRNLGLDSCGLIAAAGFTARELPRASVVSASDVVPHAEWAGTTWQVDADQTVTALHGLHPAWIVVDHYALDARWHGHVGALTGARIAVIDDLADRDLQCELLVDQNVAANHRLKYGRHLPAMSTILGGPRYALLGPTFQHAVRCSPAAEVRSIGIFMGGTDAAGLALMALQGCRDVADFRGPIEVVSTSSNARLAELEQLVSRSGPTSLAVDLPDLAAFFARHDLQIGAGGGAMWERCCIGAPTIVLVAAPNQLAVVPELTRLGAVAALHGEYAPTARRIGEMVIALAADPTRLHDLSLKGRSLVDGAGAVRVALRLMESQMRIRPAGPDDMEVAFRWRNHPSTRAVSHQAEAIDWEHHENWFRKVLVNPAKHLLIAEVGSVPVGVIRFDRTSDESVAVLEVSLYLDPKLHGLGLGRRMLERGEAFMLAEESEVDCFIASVLPGNTASHRLFRSAGYTFSGERWRKPAYGETFAEERQR